MSHDIIVIGASAGGVEAVPRLLSSLPADIAASFFVTLHVPPDAESHMPRLIERSGSLPAEHPSDGTGIQRGHVYVAPPDHHLLIEDGVVRLGHGPRENRHRPAIDPLFRSAAKVYRTRVAGVLLTGNLDDGVAGLRDIQHNGGIAIVQDPAEAAYPEMPQNALQAIKPKHCLPLKQIEALISILPDSEFGGSKMKAKHQANKLRKQRPTVDTSQPNAGPPVPVVCPECQGPLWEFRDGKLMRYQCLVGHRYSLQSLLEAQRDELEAALWFALRALEERINLQRRLEKEAAAAGRPRSRQMFRAHIAENLKQARVIREVLEKL